MGKSYEFKYADLYLYSQITKHLINGTDVREMESPFKDDDGNELRFRLRGDAIRGYGRRNWQRNALERNRGLVILLERDGQQYLAGRKSAHKDVVEIFTTAEQGSVEYQLMRKLIKHLEYNEIEVVKCYDLKRQKKLLRRFQQGDRVQREARNGSW